MKWDPLALKSEAKKEVYKLIDKHLRKLPKNQDGTINEFSEGFDDNDIKKITNNSFSIPVNYDLLGEYELVKIHDELFQLVKIEENENRN